MRRAFFVVLLFIYLLSMTGCSGSSSSLKNKYTNTIGLGTLPVIEEQITVLFSKNRFRILRREQSQNRVYYETEWLDRRPFPDEEEQGIVKVQSRIIVITRPRTQGKLHRVRFTGENQVMFVNANVWTESVMTAMCRDYFKSIANDLKTELDTRTREF